MDTQNPREEIKIWQRVRGESTITDGLPGLALSALTQAAVYDALMRQLQGYSRKLAIQLREAQLENARCIKGIYRISSGSALPVTTVPPVTEQLENVLRKSYGQSLKAYNAYQARANHPEYGAIFQYLAAKEQTLCCKIAELMSII